MTKQVQRRRGTSSQHTSFTGAEGEISVNTTNKSVHVHDGTTAGGVEAARADLTNVSDADLNSLLTGNTLSTLDINGGTIDGAVIGGNSAAAITGTAITGTSFASSGNMTFGDNDKAIFGAGSDLQIYHDGDNSWIRDAGTGNLVIRGTNLNLQKDGGESYITMVADGAVTAYYDNAPKLATTSTGVDITGTLTSDGLTVDGGATFDGGDTTVDFSLGTGRFTTVNSLVFTVDDDSNSDAQAVYFRSNAGQELATFKENGDISFYEDTGTTPKFFWDASAESLQVGSTTSDESSLFVYKNDATYPAITVRQDGSAPIQKWLGASGVTRMTLDSSGSVGIGTDSPQRVLVLSKSDSTGVQAQFTNLTTGVGASNGFTVGIDGSENAELWNFQNTDMVFATNGSEAMRIDSLGNVGIGVVPETWYTSLGTTALQLGGTTSLWALSNGSSDLRTTLDNNLYISNTGTNNLLNTGPASRYQQANGIHRWYTAASGAAGTTATTEERMRIDSSGNVGIGTSSPGALVHVSTETAGGAGPVEVMRLEVKEAAGGSLDAGDGTKLSFYTPEGNGISQEGAAIAGIRASGSDTNGATNLAFYTAGDDVAIQEAMRIDSSGNLLVGTTVANPAGSNSVGVGISSGSYGGFIGVTRDSDTPVEINRKTNDGVLIRFRKDGSTVGIIGSSNSDLMVGNSDVGLKFHDANDKIYPWNVSTDAIRDGAITLGDPAGRFNNLYLSGGVYLGGTVSANALDDYEEGVYTPTVSPSGSGSFTLNSSYDRLAYTKIGRQVTVTGLLVVSTTSSPVGRTRFTLPFACANLEDASERTAPVSMMYFNGTGAPNGNGYYTTAQYLGQGGISQVEIWGFSHSNGVIPDTANWLGVGTDLQVNITYMAAS